MDPQRLKFDKAGFERSSGKWSLADDDVAYHCPLCRDTHYVTEYTVQSMHSAIAVARGEKQFESIKVDTWAVFCKCRRAIDKAKTRTINGRMPPTAENPNVIAVDIKRNVDGRRLQLLEWAQGHLGQEFEQLAVREAPYQAFEHFNEVGANDD